jgi:hypothetical protein
MFLVSVNLKWTEFCRINAPAVPAQTACRDDVTATEQQQKSK